MRHQGFAIWPLPVALGGLGVAFVAGAVAGHYRSVGEVNVVASLQRLPGQFSAVVNTQQVKELTPLSAFTSTLDRVTRDFYDAGKLNEDELTYAAIDGMLASLGDPFTRFMDPKSFNQMQEDTRGDFVGIGAQLDTDPLGAIIKRPIPNSPAARKGLQTNDVIIKVDGKVIAGMEIDDIVRMIRGDRGKPVTLTIKRKNTEKPIDFTIIRAVINSPNVEYFMEDEREKIGRVWLGQFSEKAADQIEGAMNALEKQGMRAMVLDLRFNPGGLLTSAVQVASRLAEKGPVVIIQGKDGHRERLDTVSGLYHERNYPMVVLVNGSSASASEIIAGFLKDHGAATVIGERTFGKGLVQTVIPLMGNTATAITTAKYLTPNGTDINRRRLPTGKFEAGGVVPQVEVKPSDNWTFTNIKGDKEDLQLNKALDVLREKLGSVAVAR